MSVQDLIALVDRLRALPTETEWFEFKRNYGEAEQIGEYLSALANAACLASQPRGYLVFGIDDDTHAVVGTRFDPYATKSTGNQDLLPWLGAGLRPNTGVDVHLLDHPDGRVVVFEVGPARDQPVSFPEAVVTAREQFLVKHPSQAGEVAGWDDLTFLNKARLLKQGAFTITALLHGRSEAATLLASAVAKVSWILKDADNRNLDYEHLGPPFMVAGDRLLKRLHNLTVRALPSGTLFPRELTQYDPWVIREALHNSIAHQDYRRHARITVVEFPDRVLVANVGEFLPGSVQTVIEQDSPKLLYRNPFLADAMVELNLIDTQGGGIKRMFETACRYRRCYSSIECRRESTSPATSTSVSRRLASSKGATPPSWCPVRWRRRRA